MPTTIPDNSVFALQPGDDRAALRERLRQAAKQYVWLLEQYTKALEAHGRQLDEEIETLKELKETRSELLEVRHSLQDRDRQIEVLNQEIGLLTEEPIRLTESYRKDDTPSTVDIICSLCGLVYGHESKCCPKCGF